MEAPELGQPRNIVTVTASDDVTESMTWEDFEKRMQDFATPVRRYPNFTELMRTAKATNYETPEMFEFRTGSPFTPS